MEVRLHHLWLNMLVIIFTCLSLKTHICLADSNRITQNQSLSGNQTIVSAGSVFEMGFVKLGNSTNYYLGIWVSSSASENDDGTLWQSFDTFLPGTEIRRNKMTGFVPKSRDDYISNVYNGGGIREAYLQCGNPCDGLKSSDGFITGYAVSISRWGTQAYESVGNVRQCESVCLNRCSCNAYAYEGSRCSVWSGDVFDIHKVSVDPVGLPIYLRVTAELPSSGSNYESNYKIVNGDEENKTNLTFFTFKNVLAAIDNFSESNKLGEGDFGPVYKGNLLPHHEVAIKGLSKKYGQVLEEFTNELKLIAKLQHNYLVRLLGCCVEKEEKILIYECLPNRSLDKFLFGGHTSPY
ncbi:unnamed protein product [Linum tenue]|uniref:Uncharacterized protein n=1 Tax=Linum tenue TaxID=586396 RepID=A0AAV0QZJ0_9ROSI|nr:unnamed protein product [Linum tenue]